MKRQTITRQQLDRILVKSKRRATSPSNNLSSELIKKEDDRDDDVDRDRAKRLQTSTPAERSLIENKVPHVQEK